MKLTINHISKSFNEASEERFILKDIHFELNSGQTMAIVGRSGSGKTTLLNILAGLDNASKGTILFDEVDVTQFKEKDWLNFRKNNLGIVFQQFHLINYLTAYENVSMPMMIKWESIDDSSVKNLLTEVQLDHRMDHYPGMLSGGEQQRVAIARAFANKPKLILADEPTGNLDTETGDKIIKLLFDSALNNGTSMLIVTHDEKLAFRADRVLKIEHGLCHFLK